MSNLNIHKQLYDIQQKLIVSKSQANEFGNYKYRSCEDILEAVKEVSDCIVLLTDEIEVFSGRHYVKATAKLINMDGITISTTAYAREPENKKGMNQAQITGSCSSYARKYALNALFSIDDTKDADTMDNRHEKAKSTEEIEREGKTLSALIEAIENNDGLQMQETWKELARDEQSHYWKLINTKQKAMARELLAQESTTGESQ